MSLREVFFLQAIFYLDWKDFYGSECYQAGRRLLHAYGFAMTARHHVIAREDVLFRPKQSSTWIGRFLLEANVTWQVEDCFTPPGFAMTSAHMSLRERMYFSDRSNLSLGVEGFLRQRMLPVRKKIASQKSTVRNDISIQSLHNINVKLP